MPEGGDSDKIQVEGSERNSPSAFQKRMNMTVDTRQRLRFATLFLGVALFSFLCGNFIWADEPKNAPGPEPQSEVIRNMEARIVSRINDVRKKNDLPILEENAILSKVARDYSRRMLQEDFFSHFGPSGNTVADRVEAAGLHYRYVGENLAMTENINRPAEGLVQDWMKSPSHRKNILDEKYHQTGVGIWKERDRYYFTQIFMRSMRAFLKERKNPGE